MSFTKKSPQRPKMANTAYVGRECQVGKGRGRTRWPHVSPHGTSWRIWHKQGPSSQTTCTIILDKTIKYVMKIIQFSLSAYLLKANQIIAWHVFPTWTETNNVWQLLWEAGDRQAADWSLATMITTWESRDRQGQAWGQCVWRLVSWETSTLSGGPWMFFKWDGDENFFILLHMNVDPNLKFRN